MTTRSDPQRRPTVFERLPLRIRYGPVELPRDLRPGEARRADPALIAGLERPLRGTRQPRPPCGPRGRPAGRGARVEGRRQGVPLAAAGPRGFPGAAPQANNGPGRIDTLAPRNQNTRLILRRGTQAANGSRL